MYFTLKVKNLKKNKIKKSIIIILSCSRNLQSIETKNIIVGIRVIAVSYKQQNEQANIMR